MSDAQAYVSPRVQGERKPVWDRIRRGLLVGRRGMLLTLLVAMFVIAAMAPRIFITIPSGHAGVLWYRFFGGTDVNRPALDEGMHVIFPWDNIFIYDARVRDFEQSYEVIAHDGLHISVRVNLRWRVRRTLLPRLHKEYGPEYLKVLLIPEVGSVARDRIAQYNTEDLFSAKRSQIEKEIHDRIVANDRTNRITSEGDAFDNTNFVVLVDILLTRIILPPGIQRAIERKLEQAQIAEEYVYRLESERLESQRKLIEAQGIQAFQQTVQAGISDNYLKWRGIEATLSLATSANAKVVVIGGGGSQGLPLILNTGDSATPGPPAPLAAPAPHAELGPATPQNSSIVNSMVPRAAEPAAKADPVPETHPWSVDAFRTIGGAFGYKMAPSAPGSSAVPAPPAP